MLLNMLYCWIWLTLIAEVQANQLVNSWRKHPMTFPWEGERSLSNEACPWRHRLALNCTSTASTLNGCNGCNCTEIFSHLDQEVLNDAQKSKGTPSPQLFQKFERLSPSFRPLQLKHRQHLKAKSWDPENTLQSQCKHSTVAKSWGSRLVSTWLCLKMSCTPLYPMVLLIIIPFLNGYFIGNINPTFSDIPTCLPYRASLASPLSCVSFGTP